MSGTIFGKPNSHMRPYLYILTLILFNASLSAQKLDWLKQIDFEQNRIDILDGDLDSIISVGDVQQNAVASRLFIQKVDAMQNILRTYDQVKSQNLARGLFEYLKKIKSSDVTHLPVQIKNIELAYELIALNNDKKELELLKNEVKTSIHLADIINFKPYAKDYWVYAASFYPVDVLNIFRDLAYTPLGGHVVIAMTRIDPGAIKQYLGTNHIIDRAVKNSKDSIARLLVSIFDKYGAQSKSYALLELIVNNKMSLETAESISKNPEKFYKTLIDLRNKKNILADYTVEKELEAISMEKVVEINLRHEDKDTVRFEPIQQNNAKEIYTSIVYCPQEIFTSTFLGMYKRMMTKRKIKSGYEFLKSVEFNRFRIFIKQCAGYNKLDDFFSSMNDSQANALIAMFAGGLYNYAGNLAPAVDVADTYGSLENEKFKGIFLQTIENELRNCIASGNEHGIKIYGLLLKLTGGKIERFNTGFDFNIPNLDRVSHAALFPDSTHVQQHFFFDDEDGTMAFNSWLNLYPAAIYKKEDKGNYIVLRSIKGPKMAIYANKPQFEIAGRDDLKKLFEKNNRFPDLIVHRGHSYYIENTLNNMTNSNKVALLGSCGGYQNISKAMENAFDVQIISTKQVGTLAVNTVLIQEITEAIRSGKDLVWMDIWKSVSAKLKDNQQFKDYIPPYKNLGARFIKAYNEL